MATWNDLRQYIHSRYQVFDEAPVGFQKSA
jgi:hypothetical protein